LHLFSFFNAHDSQVGLLMELVSSCIFFSQVLSCLSNSSSFFPLISILSLSFEILSSACSSLLEWPSFCFVFLFHYFFLRFSIWWITSSLILSTFILNSFISLFMVCSVSFWCLFRTSMVSFICYCTFSYSLFLLTQNFLSVSCTFWLTMSSIISVKFSLITHKISSFRVFLWSSLGFLV
jgi:hypothetical protein